MKYIHACPASYAAAYEADDEEALLGDAPFIIYRTSLIYSHDNKSDYIYNSQIYYQDHYPYAHGLIFVCDQLFCIRKGLNPSDEVRKLRIVVSRPFI